MRYPVELDRSHLTSLAGKPLVGITELIWNAIDADATRIDIELLRGEAGGVTGFVISDDGHGITPDQARASFLRLGGSWKHLTERSPGGRALHGKLGQGRFTAFSNGGSATWTSVAASAGGGGQARTIIQIDAGQIDACDITGPEPTSAPTGTRVEVSGLSQPVEGVDGATPRAQLLTSLALAIAAYGLRIVFDGEELDLEQVQNHRARYPLESHDGRDASLVVIEWSTNTRRALFLCNAAGVALHEMTPGFRVTDFRFSAYVSWDGFADQLRDLPVIELEHGSAKALLDAARQRLQEHFEERRGERRRSLVAEWRSEGVYPFAGEPSGPAEEATRETFDLVALHASSLINQGKAPARKLSLRLLRAALERSPHTLHHVLRDVLALDEQQIDELSDLLEKTPLVNVIAASSAIASRLEMLEAIAAMTTSPTWRRQVLERSELHKVLEQETWVFGEEYGLAVSDKALTTVLEYHRAALGMGVDGDDELPEGPAGEVLDSSGRRRIVDLLLDMQIPKAENERHHLVIELKRPSVAIGPAELEQIKNYADAVASDQRFNTTGVRWEFWAISGSVVGSADRARRQKDRPVGLVEEWDGPRVQIWVKTWSEVLQQAEHRLKFVRGKLGYAPGEQQALGALRAKHAASLPQAMLAETDDQD